jgi:hypothetical protein
MIPRFLCLGPRTHGWHPDRHRTGDFSELSARAPKPFSRGSRPQEHRGDETLAITARWRALRAALVCCAAALGFLSASMRRRRASTRGLQ